MFEQKKIPDLGFQSDMTYCHLGNHELRVPSSRSLALALYLTGRNSVHKVPHLHRKVRVTPLSKTGRMPYEFLQRRS